MERKVYAAKRADGRATKSREREGNAPQPDQLAMGKRKW